MQSDNRNVICPNCEHPFAAVSASDKNKLRRASNGAVEQEWIEYSGGGMPRHAFFNLVDIQFRDGEIVENVDPDGYEWKWSDSADDIVKWRRHDAQITFNQIAAMANILHYPEDWDTEKYPGIFDAVLARLQSKELTDMQQSKEQS